jgi:hypothetical protein
MVAELARDTEILEEVSRETSKKPSPEKKSRGAREEGVRTLRALGMPGHRSAQAESRKREMSDQ